MDYTIIFKIAAVGILTAVVSQVLKNIGKDEFSTFTTLAGIIVVIAMSLNLISGLFNSVKELFLLF